MLHLLLSLPLRGVLQTLSAPHRPTLLVAVPIGMSEALAALVPCHGGCFAVPLQPGVPLLQQMAEVSKFLPCDEQPQQMNITRDAHGDIIFALPVVFPVVTALHRPPPPQSLRGWKAVWCMKDALSDLQFAHTVLALDRCQSFGEAVPWLRSRIGVMEGPVPVTPHRAAAAYRDGVSLAAADTQWAEFLESERLLFPEILLAFTAADAGTGILLPFITSIATASTMAAELVPPRQGLPPLDAAAVSLLPYPPPPMPLHTDYLARNPPQALPPGFPAELQYAQVIRRWGRRAAAEAFNVNAAHSFDCYANGWSDMPRHPFVCLGPGVFKNLHLHEWHNCQPKCFLLGGGVRWSPATCKLRIHGPQRSPGYCRHVRLQN